MMGLYWTYMGPTPAPPIRRMDVAAYPVDNIREMNYDTNWVQVVENHVDSTHIYILHQQTAARGSEDDKRNSTRGNIDHLIGLEYEEVEFGIRRKIAPDSSYQEDDLLIFPNMLRRVNQVQIHVPIDDTHTRTYKLAILCDGVADDQPTNYYVLQDGDGKYGTSVYPDARYRMSNLTGEDVMAIETQGAVSSRTSWRVATSDRGVVLFERAVLREIDRVASGERPYASVTAPGQIIDTNFEHFRQTGGGSTNQYSYEGLQVYKRNAANGTNGHTAAAAASGARA